MPEIYVFDKSLNERREDYIRIFRDERGDDFVPTSEVLNKWIYHVGFVLPSWQALWKIPRSTCQDLNIDYPSTLAVKVELIHMELTALVKIAPGPADNHLPSTYTVPLIELYPTKEQDDSNLDMKGTAEFIDQLRFFYNNLWMPWDEDDDESADWIFNHLQSRLNLYFDMKEGRILRNTCDMIRNLKSEGKDIQEKINKLEFEINKINKDNRGEIDEDRSCQLMQLHSRLRQIKNEMEVLENPEMRNMLQ